MWKNISDISSLLLLANMKSPDIHQQVARIQQIEIPQQQQRGAEYNISELEPSEKNNRKTPTEEYRF